VPLDKINDLIEAQMMDALLQDVRYALRMMRRKPGFTAVVVLALAIGIGANAAIFSVVNGVLLRPLPFQNAEELMTVWRTNPQLSYPLIPFSYPDFKDLREQCETCEDVGAWNIGSDTRLSLTGGDEPEQIQYALVSANLFSVLGVRPMLGRSFLREEESSSGPTIIISHSLWQRRFNSDAEIIGKALALDHKSYTIIGVMRPGFNFPHFSKHAQVWVPIASDPTQPNPDYGRRWVRTIRYLGVIARLKPGVTQEQANREVGTIASRLQQQYPDANTGWGMSLIPLHKQIVGSLGQALLILFAAVGFVLLIACANVANLLLARATARQKEIAVRIALGASRARILRQLLTESILLSLLGGGAGLLIALWGSDLFSALPDSGPSFFTPFDISQNQVGINGMVLIFTLLLSLATGAIFGIAPALQVSKSRLNESLKEESFKSSSGRSGRIRNLLVASEVAISLVLLIGAGLMIRSFIRLQKVDPGFNPENVLTAEVNLPQSKYSDDNKAIAFYQQLLERAGGLPEVQSVGAISVLPLSGAENGTGFFIEGQPPPPPGEKLTVWRRTVTPDYFRAMRIAVVNGRAFTIHDNKTSSRVVIINEAMARQFWPDESPIGKRIAPDFEAIKFDIATKSVKTDIASALREIVGVVKDVKHTGLDVAAKPEMYLPFEQAPERNMTIVLRSESGLENLRGELQREVLVLDKDQPLANTISMSQLLSNSVAKPRFNFQLLSILAAIALVLGMIGVYGVMSYSVSERTREIGIRMALGANHRDVVRMVVKEGFTLSVIGIALGLAGALSLTRFLSSLMFGLSATDPLTFIITSLLLALVALLASYVPARRAARVDPMIALRHE
jgi:putative ABC transport system permease protein